MACNLCLGEGVVFVKTPREDIKSLAMHCNCGCHMAQGNFWALPGYSSEYIIIKSPYPALRVKVGAQKASDYFKQHMKKSKLIWDGEI